MTPSVRLAALLGCALVFTACDSTAPTTDNSTPETSRGASADAEGSHALAFGADSDPFGRSMTRWSEARRGEHRGERLAKMAVPRGVAVAEEAAAVLEEHAAICARQLGGRQEARVGCALRQHEHAGGVVGRPLEGEGWSERVSGPLGRARGGIGKSGPSCPAARRRRRCLPPPPSAPTPPLRARRRWRGRCCGGHPATGRACDCRGARRRA